MKDNILFFSLVALCTLMFVVPSSALEKDSYTKIEGGESRTTLKKGSPAPYFTIENLDGSEFSLESYKDKNPVMLFFWSFFCGPCREEIPLINDLAKRYNDKGLIVAGVNLDGSEMKKAISKFKEQEKISYIIAFDELEGDSFKVSDPYGVLGTPTLFIIDREGKIAYSVVGATKEPVLKNEIEKVLK